MRIALLFLAGCSAVAPLSGTQPPCIDGYVDCAGQVCVAADELCPVAWNEIAPWAPLVELRRAYGLGGSVCGGELVIGGLPIERWRVRHEPGELVLEIDAEVDGDVDERVTLIYSRPDRLDAAIHEQLTRDQADVRYTWTHVPTSGRVSMVEEDHDRFVLDATTTWDYRVRRYTATRTFASGEPAEEDVVELDADFRISHVAVADSWSWDYAYDGEGRVAEATRNFFGYPDSTTRYAYDGGGRLAGWTRDGTPTALLHDRYARVSGLETDHGEFVATTRYFHECD